MVQFTRYFIHIIPLLLITLHIPVTYAQIGINTNNPQGVLHIDPQGNTGGSTNYSDDIVIDTNGNIGLGTLTPQAKFDITGKFRLSDGSGTDFTDYILASDASGKALWKNYLIALRYKTIEWKLENTAWPAINASSNIFTMSGTPTLKSELAVTTTSNSLTIPKGRYLIFMTADIENVSEYAEISLLQNGSTILSTNYIRALSACTTYIETTTTVTLSIQFKVYDVRSNASAAIPFLDAFPYTSPNHIWTSLVLLGLDVGG
ncbi:hypothetical protein [Dysgonomonas macrotermitis]|uniref:Uncharacterized protein n=1 Tax=Dysgonomonas macrotermitis TaxID=1346286 RepID=A0A1M5K3J1_9BACT|nr:hypothetical protein [Dysgonomonas macrotermitis]SHG47069.1 hypothetical protein SAMN05444362_1344 [Dysgonomonas macrotermitis]